MPQPPEEGPFDRSPYSSTGAPPPLVVAAGLTFIQGLLTAIFGITEAFRVSADRLAMGVTTSLFFVVYGGLLVLCAWALNAIRPWARGPVLFAQLVWLGLAWNFRDGNTRVFAIGLLIIAALTLAGLLHPRSVDAINRADEQH